jgi:pectate lyase
MMPHYYVELLPTNLKNIEIRNLGFKLWRGEHDGDGITLKSSVGVWVHNNDQA